MAIEITMPRLSDTMEEGTLIKWNVKVGDKVESGDTLADVETDKATMELQSFDDGVVAKLAAEEGQSLPVGGLIAVLAEEGESVDEAASDDGSGGSAQMQPPRGDDAPSGESSSPATTTPAVTTVATAESPPTVSAARVRISPVARKIADEHGVDFSAIIGTGPGGRIIKRDVLAAIQSPSSAAADVPDQAAQAAEAPTAAPVSPGSAPITPPPALETKTVALTNMRKTVARRLVESKTTIPHFTVTVTVNMDPLLQLRASVNAALESEGVKLSVNDFIVRAAAVAIARHPQVNASWVGDSIQQHGQINVGVAVALPDEKGGGLVVPTIRDAANLPLRQISAKTRALAKKARGQGLTLEEMSDGTFTVSNLGMLGVDHFEAIINPPQAAILAVGAAVEKPVVRDGEITIGHEMTCTLSADHRVIDGAVAATYLQTLKTLLESPAAALV